MWRSASRAYAHCLLTGALYADRRSGRRRDGTQDRHYRLHHASAYPGTNYDDLAPVYRYGHHLRRRTMFAGQGWDEVENALPAEW